MRNLLLAALLALALPVHAQTKISALPAALTLTGPEFVYCVQGSLDRKCTATQIKTFAQSGLGATYDPLGAAAAAQAASQPLDSDLTAIAALTTTAYGRAFLELANAGAGRTALGLGTLATQSGTFSGSSSGTNTGDQDLSGLAVKSANLSDLTSASTARTNLGLGALSTVTPGSGIATAAAVNVGSAGSFVINGGAGGTPSSLTLTNATALPPAGVTGTAAVLGTNTFTADQRINGSLGVGGIAPGTALDVNGAFRIRSANAFYFQNATADGNVTLSNTGSGAGISQLSIGTGIADAVVVAHGGNVGIGATSPAGKLTVVGASNAGISIDQASYNYYAAFEHRFFSPAYATELLNVASTKVSVLPTTDSTSPTTGALTVAGGVGIAKDLIVGGNAKFGDIIRNYGSGNAWFQYATDTRFININAGGAISFRNNANDTSLLTIANTGATTFAADATINGLTVGRGAGNVGTNTGIGYQALQSNTTGVGNVAIGYQALKANTTGGVVSGNTAVGATAMLLNQSGSNNAAFGIDALYSMVSGDNNTAIGSNALGFGTGGDSNTAVGWRSLFNGAGGTANTAIGLTSLNTMTAGSNNTGLGTSALYSLTSASNNTSVGTYSLYSNSTGASNVALGFGAGYFETGSSKLFIDNQSRADESDGRAKALVYGVFAADPANQILRLNAKVGINSGTPSAQMDVRGPGGVPQFDVWGASPGYVSYRQIDSQGNHIAQTALEGSLGGTMAVGSLPWSAVFGSIANDPMHLMTNDTVRFTISETGIISLNSPTDSSSATTGAFIVPGGVGIGKQLSVGGKIFGYRDAGYAGPDQITISGYSNANQQLLIGYNTTSNYGSIQVVLQGTGYKPLRLNESGGEVVIGTASSPASSAACTAGGFSWDASYIYVCTASGAYKRAALTGGY